MSLRRFTRRRAVALGAALALCALAGPGTALAQVADPLPDDLEGVGIEPRLDAPLPLERSFVDEQGRTIRLGDYFDGERPVLLVLAYYRCPMLCTLVLNGMIDALRPVDLRPGDEFQIVVLSIDPTETPDLARQKKEAYLAEYGRPGVGDGWHFLTGRSDDIRAVADAIGFHYRFVKERGEYAHGAGLFLATPDGRLSRFLNGVRFDQNTVRLSLLEASEGQIGSAFDQFVLFCFHYDETKGAYAPAARTLMQAGGALMVMVLGGSLLAVWRRAARRRKASA